MLLDLQLRSAMHSDTQLLIPSISWTRCLIIKMRKKSWTSSASSGKKKLTISKLSLDKMYKDFEAEQVMLSDELKEKKGR